MHHRGYVLRQSAGGYWTAEHEAFGPVNTALVDGTLALLSWRSLPKLKLRIDRTFRAPGDES